MADLIARADILAEAATWIGTPYQHQASTKGAGCDCLGLVRGIWRKFYGGEPLDMPPYTPDWAEQSGAETLKQAADKCLERIDLDAARPADILLFRMAPNAPAKHMAIFADRDLIIHAYWGRSVTKSFLAPFWLRRRAYAYRFPNIEASL